MELSYVTQTIIDSLSLIDFSLSLLPVPFPQFFVYTRIHQYVFLLPGKLLFTN